MQEVHQLPSVMVVTHVPAWKRLGLKLKYAPEVPGKEIESHEQNGKKRKSVSTNGRDIESESALKPSKKVKKSKKPMTGPDATSSPTTNLSLPTSELDKTPERATPPSQTSTKRKFVSFTPDTKTADGDSIKQLYHTWLSQQKDDFDPAKHSEALRSLTPRTSFEPKTTAEVTKVKKSKPAKPISPSPASKKAQSAAQPLTSTIDYLSTYYASRSTWKFNKSKQNQLLKHAFDTSKIPSEYDSALRIYIMGLEGNAARARMRERALEIREDDTLSSLPETTATSTSDDSENGKETARTDSFTTPGTTGTASSKFAAAESEPRSPGTEGEPESEKRRKQDYKQALERYKQQLKSGIIDQEEIDLRMSPEWRLKLYKRKRAEMILWCVGEEGPPSANVNGNNAGGMVTSGANGVNGTKGISATPEKTIVQTTIESGNATKKQKTANGVPAPVKKKRKRKRRTGVPDDDSSSSESSSSSSSSSNESDSGDNGNGDGISDGSSDDSSDSSDSSSSAGNETKSEESQGGSDESSSEETSSDGSEKSSEDNTGSDSE